MSNEYFFQKDYDALVKFREPHPALEDAGQFEKLTKNEWVKINSYKIIKLDMAPAIDAFVPDMWLITPGGKDRLLAYEEMVRQQAEDKAQQRFQNKISVLQVLIPAVTFVLGLVVEHLTGVVELVAQLLGNGI